MFLLLQYKGMVHHAWMGQVGQALALPRFEWVTLLSISINYLLNLPFNISRFGGEMVQVF